MSSRYNNQWIILWNEVLRRFSNTEFIDKACIVWLYNAMLLMCVMFSAPVYAKQPLTILSSDNAESRANNSFIFIPENKKILQGIKRDAGKKYLKPQVPFVVDLPVSVKDTALVQWHIITSKLDYGEINVLSDFHMEKVKSDGEVIWSSEILRNDTADRTRLVFKPQPLAHYPGIYKRGRGTDGKRRNKGGGTVAIDFRKFNPRISYYIEAVVTDLEKQALIQYTGKIAMDNKDMIRQEYINHYNINRYGRGENGNIPVPKRDEITKTPSVNIHLLGNSLSESSYGLMIDDGVASIAGLVVDLYEQTKNKYKKSKKKFFDLNKRELKIPDTKLWLSGGWRNPERNEWFSNALNGIHQRGGAIDLVANVPHSDKRSAIIYWFLWNALENQNYIKAFWQLEAHGRAMTTKEYTEDIEPVNGIPDAFDKADHIHINIKYD